MSDITKLIDCKLTPVVELEPWDFANSSRPSPTASRIQRPSEWVQYWRDSMADAGLNGISPIAEGSWHVATNQFSDSQLEIFLDVVVAKWDGRTVLDDPELNPFLNGGLVLSTDDQGVIAEPTCCSDLSNIESWVQAASFKGDQWKSVWIGHPYPSMKYRAPDLIISELHESEAPVERWSVLPGELLAAVKTAETELHRFAKAIASILTDRGVQRDVHSLAKRMAGLTGDDD